MEPKGGEAAVRVRGGKQALLSLRLGPVAFPAAAGGADPCLRFSLHSQAPGLHALAAGRWLCRRRNGLLCASATDTPQVCVPPASLGQEHPCFSSAAVWEKVQERGAVP